MKYTPGTDPTIRSLVRKIGEVAVEITKVEKRGKNAHFNYNYVTEDDLTNAVRGRLADKKVWLFSSLESVKIDRYQDAKEKEAFSTVAQTMHLFIDGESGEQIEIGSGGHATKTDDKGLYGIMTGALKYALQKNFLIPSFNDPEMDHNQASTYPDKKSSRSITRTTEHVMEEGGKTPMAKPTPNPKWRDVICHFGKNKDKRLGELEEKYLQWYVENWTPNPKYKIKPEDAALLDALAGYKEEMAKREGDQTSPPNRTDNAADPADAYPYPDPASERGQLMSTVSDLLLSEGVSQLYYFDLLKEIKKIPSTISSLELAPDAVFQGTIDHWSWFKKRFDEDKKAGKMKGYK